MTARRPIASIGQVTGLQAALDAAELSTRRTGIVKLAYGNLTATASSIFSASFAAAKAVNGNAEISTSGEGWLSAASEMVGAWLSVDIKDNRIVAFGDSITAGHPLHDPNPAVYTTGDNPESDWCFQLSAMTGYTVINKGFGSTDTTNWKTRFNADVVLLKPKYVFIGGPVNNISAGTPEATTQADLTTLYNQAVSGGVIPVLCTILPWNGGTVEQKASISSVNTWIRAQAAANGWPLCDFYAAMEDPANLGNCRAGDISGDNIHPNIAGYRRMTDAFPTLAKPKAIRGVMLSQKVGTAPSTLRKITQVSLWDGSRRIGVFDLIQTAGVNDFKREYLPLPMNEVLGNLKVRVEAVSIKRHPGITDGQATDYCGIGELELFIHEEA